MLLAPIPWAERIWALPFFTVLAPSERYHASRGRRHETIVTWAGQMILRLARGLPDRRIIVVMDPGYTGQRLVACAA